jgi:hypothetical protein
MLLRLKDWTGIFLIIRLYHYHNLNNKLMYYILLEIHNGNRQRPEKRYVRLYKNRRKRLKTGNGLQGQRSPQRKTCAGQRSRSFTALERKQ